MPMREACTIDVPAHAPAIMIARKAADMIRGRTPLAPVNL
jgi:hypothetical protein